ncbi:MAG: hypothetical protein JOZ08_04235 [Verrucomicrobia bacterium]|nr:hypothetical protein [Verrucomicrobiota bacterium]MBV8277823.1 hypothetical protein [Verrucomicrobiota bacterium]
MAAFNGVQIGFVAPRGTGKIRISGQNQNGAVAEWNGVADPNSDGATVSTVTSNWWWKGTVQIWYNDGSGKTHFFTANVPSVDLQDDTYTVFAPGDV